MAENDTLALMAADLALAMYYRTKEEQDSAFAIGTEALAAARAVNDPYHIALVQGGLGFAAVRIDSLRYAKSVFTDMLAYQGDVAASFHDVAYSGLADYYHRSHMYDSAETALGNLGHVINSSGVDGTRAYSLHVLGRLLRDTGRLDSAATILSKSLELWRSLQSPADVIDNLNDLGSTNRQRQNFFEARKYYMAAGILADKLGFKDKNLYTADMNLLFLKGLKPQEFVRAGDEGKAWAEAFAGK
jgi:tetratricopeptide (TPR) repeat protein